MQALWTKRGHLFLALGILLRAAELAFVLLLAPLRIGLRARAPLLLAASLQARQLRLRLVLAHSHRHTHT